MPSSCPSEVQKAQAGSKEAAAAQKVVEEAQLAEQEKEWCAALAAFSIMKCERSASLNLSRREKKEM